MQHSTQCRSARKLNSIFSLNTTNVRQNMYIPCQICIQRFCIGPGGFIQAEVQKSHSVITQTSSPRNVLYHLNGGFLLDSFTVCSVVKGDGKLVPILVTPERFLIRKYYTSKGFRVHLERALALNQVCCRFDIFASLR